MTIKRASLKRIMRNVLVGASLTALSALSFAQIDGKFTAKNGKTLLIIGQDLDSVEGYVNSGHFPEIGGVTNYTDVYNFGGIDTDNNYGSGTMNLQKAIDTYPNSVLSIGLWMVEKQQADAQGPAFPNGLTELVNGVYDDALQRFADFANRNDPHPIFLRIGYEFDGSWNSYEPNKYKNAFRYIRDYLDGKGVTNVAYVFQSATWVNTGANFDAYYPGDEYVDWMGLSFFFYADDQGNSGNADELLAMVEYARAHNKPLQISESSAQYHDFNEGKFHPFDNPGSPSDMTGQEAWDQYFRDQLLPFVHNNSDVIRQLAYINADWQSQPQWRWPDAGNGFWGDTRIETDPTITANWVNEISDTSFWQHGGPGLFSALGIEGGVTPTPTPTGTATSTPTPTPTNTPNPGGWEQISFEDFENGFVEWEDGGNDVFLRKNTEHRSSGVNSANIQDDSGPKSTIRQLPFDATQYQELEISFWYKPISMELGEFFRIQFLKADGKWANLVDYVKGEDFVKNGNEYSALLTINAADYAFATNSRFRIRCFGNTNADDIFIDDILVRGFVAGGGETESPTPTSTPTATPTFTPTPGSVTLEAESGTPTGGNVRTYDDNAASGRLGIAYMDTVGESLVFNNAPAATEIEVLYASVNTGKLSVRVNNTDVGDINFNATGGWVGSGNYQTASIVTNVPSGATLTFFYDNGDAAMNIDTVTFINAGNGGDTPTPTPTPDCTGNCITPTPTPTATPVVGGVTGKFAPVDGRTMMIVGQDLQSVSGYRDSSAPEPAGVTTYIALYDLLNDRQGFGALGLFANDEPNNYDHDWGGGPLNAYSAAVGFPNSALQIGMSLAEGSNGGTPWCDGCLAGVGQGNFDAEINQLADFFLKIPNKAVYLRIGYEFDGTWNTGYFNREAWIAAYKRIVDILRQRGVTNVAYVWQSAASPIDDTIEIYLNQERAVGSEDPMDWYPGDDYVDWVGLSWFLLPNEQGLVHGATEDQMTKANRILDIARDRQKPVMIAETTPQGYDIGRLQNCNISQIWDGTPGGGCVAKSADQIWNEWFVPTFNYVRNNSDVIKAVSYINANWNIQTSWAAPYNSGYWGDTRVEANSALLSNWNTELSDESFWLHGSSNINNDIGF